MKALSPQLTFNNAQGFTLIECLCTLGIVSILALMVTPSLHTWQEKNTTKQWMHKLQQHITMAMVAARNQQQPVRYCPSNNGLDCGDNWHEGLMIQLQGSQPQTLFYTSGLPEAWQLEWTSSFHQNDHLDFTAQGFTHGQQGHFTLTDPQKNTYTLVAPHSGQAHWVNLVNGH